MTIASRLVLKSLRLLIPLLLAGATLTTGAAESALHNIYGRQHQLLDGRWNYIVDPYETGYYNYRRQPYDQSETGSGGFYDDRKPRDKGDIASNIPTLSTDWWNYGGITRDVLLAEVPETHIADYQIQLAKGELNRIEGFVQLAGPQRSQDVQLAIPEAGIKVTMHTGTDGRAAVSIPLARNKLRYWSPEDPKLYAVTPAATTDKVEDSIGFRTIETRGHDILLNGKSVFLRGVSLHDENPLIPGRLRGSGDMRMLLQWAKEMNCNYVRLA
jgi:hypothetical protein